MVLLEQFGPAQEYDIMPEPDRYATIQQILVDEFAKSAARREAARVSPDAPDACRRCGKFRGVHCSACETVICRYECHIVYVLHGGHVAYVETNPITGDVIPQELLPGWFPVMRICPTCGHPHGAERENGEPVCLACGAGWTCNAPATDAQMEAILAHHGTLTLRLDLDDATRQLLGDTFRPEHRGEKVINVDAEAAPYILGALDMVPSAQG